MVDVALAGLRWVASPIVHKLLANASTYLGVDMARELHELEATILPQFHLVIEAAEKSPHKSKLEVWLRQLKEAFYDAEDLLDEHEYNLLECKAKNRENMSPGLDSSSIKSRFTNSFRSVKRRASNLRLENRRIISKLNELKAILEEGKDFCELFGIPTRNSAEGSIETIAIPLAKTTSLLASKVFGRDLDRDRIVDILLSQMTAAETSSASYLGLAIVGVGGMGKSTLAQYVYNDERVEGYFDVRMWVCISRKLDVYRHTREIIESAAKGECPRVDNLDTLQCKLRDMLKESRRFLLVLDDVWFQGSDTETEWQQFLAPLVSQRAGGKVLVTSQRDTLPAALRCKQVVRLENMDDVEFLSLFKYHSFSGAEIVNQRLRMKLEETAEKIATNLGQSPLAAKVVGSQLSRKKDIVAWKDALTSNNISEPMRALLWSYEKLDPRLQRCFLYCSLYPKGQKYKTDELVHLWVAEGLVDLCNYNRSMEDVGRDYFNDLVSGSFFQLVTKRFGTWYIMHDLLHDLAESLSREHCFRLEDDSLTEIPCTVRHLSVRVESMNRHMQSICKLHHLRTVICIDPLTDDVSDVFHQILRNLKKVRVLYLSCYNSSKLPESVGVLKHLRYLNLVKTLISELPKSLGTLYHLQLLWLNSEVKCLPHEICNLSKLRHLGGFDELYKIVLPQIPDIGKLTSLQHLQEFCVKREKGHELRQLRHMNELGGRLKITNLDNVTGKDGALESKLHKKSRLTKLKLVWSSVNDIDIEDRLHLEILDGLMPGPQLNGLTIKGYKSATYPRWLLMGSYLENLESFGLVNCNMLESLPFNTELFKHCSKLRLDNVPNLKTLSCLPEGLTYLSVARCPRLMLVTDDELKQNGQRENITSTDHLASQFALIWEADSKLFIKKLLLEELSSMKQLKPMMDDDFSEHLETIKRASKEILVKENIIRHGCAAMSRG